MARVSVWKEEHFLETAEMVVHIVNVLDVMLLNLHLQMVPMLTCMWCVFYCS